MSEIICPHCNNAVQLDYSTRDWEQGEIVEDEECPHCRGSFSFEVHWQFSATLIEGVTND